MRVRYSSSMNPRARRGLRSYLYKRAAIVSVSTQRQFFIAARERRIRASFLGLFTCERIGNIFMRSAEKASAVL
jgi:hypothetical protein